MIVNLVDLPMNHACEACIQEEIETDNGQSELTLVKEDTNTIGIQEVRSSLFQPQNSMIASAIKQTNLI